VSHALPGPQSSSVPTRSDIQGPSKLQTVASLPMAALPKDAFIKAIVHYDSQVLQIAISSQGASYKDLCARIERKMKLCGFDVPSDLFRSKRIQCKMDGRESFVGDTDAWFALMSDSDVLQIFGTTLQSKERVLHLYLT
jgi:hypothetical protein